MVYNFICCIWNIFNVIPVIFLDIACIWICHVVNTALKLHTSLTFFKCNLKFLSFIVTKHLCSGFWCSSIISNMESWNYIYRHMEYGLYNSISHKLYSSISPLLSLSLCYIYYLCGPDCSKELLWWLLAWKLLQSLDWWDTTRHLDPDDGVIIFR